MGSSLSTVFGDDFAASDIAVAGTYERPPCGPDRPGHVESLLASLTARFINLPADQVDGAIEDAQRLFCQELGLDHSALYQFADNGMDLLLTHLRQPSDGPRVEKRLDPATNQNVYWTATEGTPATYVRHDVKAHFPWIYDRIRGGEITVVSSPEDLPEQAANDRQALVRFGTKSTAIIPLLVGGVRIGCLTFAAMHKQRDWSEADVRRFRAVADVFASALARKRADSAMQATNAQLRQSEEELRRTLDEVKRLQAQLQHENVYLRKEVQVLKGKMPIVGGSEALLKVILAAQQVAPTDSTILILGETGTGKELLAQYIHGIGARSAKPFVTTNIAAIPATLLESELFGREKGAYTGALARQIGRFEMADGGTLFLDEIGEMPTETQSKLLRVLQSGEFERLGSSRTLHVNVRVIAATNRKLADLISSGSFRQDLFYRLNVFPITLPPLRERREDIPSLVWAFVKELSDRMGKSIDRIRRKDLEALQRYDWPGNVRELRNVIEHSMILTDGEELRPVLPEGQQRQNASLALRDVEKEHILQVLKSSGGRIYGPGGASQILGIKASTLYSLMKRLGIERTRPGDGGSSAHR